MVTRISALPWRCIAARYSSQSLCSPAMHRKYSTSGSIAPGRSSTSAVPLTCTHAPPKSSDRTSALTWGWRRALCALARSRVRGDHYPARGVQAAGHRGQLRCPIPPGGDQHHMVAVPDEVEQFHATDHVRGGYLRGHPNLPITKIL